MTRVCRYPAPRATFVPNYVWRLLGVLIAGSPVSAWALCSTSSTNIICSTSVAGLDVNAVRSTLDGMTVTVTPSGQASTLVVGPAVLLTGNNTTLNNSGAVDATLGGLTLLGGTGASMGNAVAGGTITVNNTSTGRIVGSGLNLLGLVNLNGLALELRSNGSGAININNAGLISAQPPASAVNLGLFNTPSIAAYGGAPVSLTNTGTINGRVGFGSSATGNKIVNAGTINGSVYMGAGSTNRFTAVTGSAVNAGSGVVDVDVLNVLGLGLGFAQTGTVNGGENGNNTLVLQNAATGTGSGTTGTGTASSTVYKNFQNLLVNSGTWTLNGALVSGQSTLNGGLVTLDNNAALGSGQIKSNGGAIAAVAAGVTLANAVNLDVGGLTVQGAGNVALNGVVAGAGGLTKTGTNTLTLAGANAYTGGTTLAGGTLTLGNAAALGTGALTVDAASTLQNTAAITAANNVALNADLAVVNTTGLGLSGNMSGAGALVKSGAGTLALSGTNTYSGGTALNGGVLSVGSNTALGTGLLTVGAASALQSTAAVTLQNALALNNTLSLNGANNLALAGPINGAGGLVKSGAGAVTLSGNNSYTGATTLNGGTVNVGSNTALGSGAITVGGATTLSSLGNVALANSAQLNAALTVDGANALALNGVLAGNTGSLVKNGAGSLALDGANTYTGGTTLNAGMLIAGSNTALGTGALIVGGASTLDSNKGVALGNAVQLGGNLTVGGTQDLALGGTLSGAGRLTKNGAGNLTLAGANVNSGGIQLNAGTLTAGSAQALGSGALDVGGNATLGAGGQVLDNGIRIGAGSTLGLTTDATTATLGGAISGAGGLALNDGGTLTLSGANSYSGGTTLNAGRLVLGSDTALGSGTVTVAGNAALDATQDRLVVNNVDLGAGLTVDSANNLTLAGDITGAGSLVKNGTGTLTLTGANAYGGATINAGTLQGNSASLAGNVVDNARLVFAQNAAGTYAGSISGTGSVDVNAPGLLTLSGVNTFTGGLNVLSGAVQTAGGQALADNLAVNVSGGAQLRIGDSEALGSISGAGDVLVGSNATMRLGLDNADSIFGGNLAGAGVIAKAGAGTLDLTGTSSHTGIFNVEGGRLQVDGSLQSGAVNVNAGAALAGTGTVAGPVTVADNGILQARSGQTLTMGGLALNGASQLNVALGAPTSQALVQANGNLTLDGQLNVSDAGGFGAGVYRIIGYTGTLTDNGLALGSLPLGTQPSNLLIQTAVNQQVNLVVQNGAGTVQFWNGTRQAGGLGAPLGGSGTWASNNSNWTDQSGAATQPWNGNFGVFGGVAGGTVNVAGTQNLNGLQFFTDGYTLNGTGALNLAAGNDVIRVDPTLTARIDTAITGTGALQKRDAGTLILGGDNSYSGGTVMSEGVLLVDSDTRLGASGAPLAFDGGTLRISGDGYAGSARSITVGAAGGTLDIASPSNSFTLAQDLAGGGRLAKAGAGTLALSGNNSGIAGIDLNAGKLVAGSATALGAGVLNVNGATQLDSGVGVTLGNDIAIGAGATLINTGTNDLALNGAIGGATGALVKAGPSTLTLNGASTYGGGTSLTGGAINVGSDTALGSGALTVGGAGQLLTDGTHTLSNLVALNANLSVGGTGNLTLANTVSGPGTLIKTGAGSLTLNGANTYAATQLAGGTLVAGNNGALGAGMLTVSGAGALDAGTPVTLDNDILLNAGLTVRQSNDVTLAGDISGGGALTVGGANTTVTLSGDNIYTGGTQLNGGHLQVGSNTALGTGILQVDGAATLAGAPAGPRLSLINGVQLNDALTVTGDRDLLLEGIVSGAGSLTKDGNSTLTLRNGNFYTGGTNLLGGTLVAVTDASLGAGTLNVTGPATLSSGADQSVALSNNVVLGNTLTLDSPSGITLNGAVSGTGGLVKNGSSVLTLNGVNTYEGGTQLNGGLLVLGSSQALGTGTLTATGAQALTGASIEGATDLVLANAIELNGDLGVIAADHPVTLNGVISGAGSLEMTPGGKLTLTGDNTYSGGTGIDGGTLVLGSNTALGTGALRVEPSFSGSTLDSTGAFNVQNDILLQKELSLAGSQNLRLDGNISGTGGLVKNGAGNIALNGANSYQGGTTLNAGTLTLGNASALGAPTSVLTVNGSSAIAADGNLDLANAITINGALAAVTDNGLQLSGAIDGAGSLVKQGAGTLTLTGANTYTGGTQVQAGRLVGDTGSLVGNIDTGADAQLVFDQAAVNGEYAGVLSGAGSVQKTGSNVLTLSGNNTLTGTVDVATGTLAAQGGHALATASLVNVGTGAMLQLNDDEAIGNLGGGGRVLINPTATLALGGAGDSIFAGSIDGTGGLTKTGAGSLTLTGANTHTGATDVIAGTLAVNGTLNSATVNIGNGATLTGNGQLTGAVALASGANLNVDSTRGGPTMGSLAMSDNTQFNVSLGAAANSSPVVVGGNLVLDGKLNVADAGGFGTGVYRLINYGGALTNNVLDVNTLPSGTNAANVSVQTAIAGQVNLLNESQAGEIKFWDGAGPGNNNAIEGGNGTWDATTANWTDDNGATNTAWGGRYGVFEGQAGTVTATASQNVTGLQFSSDGYVIAATGAGALNAIGDVDGYTGIRVEPGLTATITAPITGGPIAKRDSGTLILGGANTYTGGTRLEGGLLQVDADTELGAAGAPLAFNGGTLRVTGTALPAIARPVSLEANGGTFDIFDPAETLALTQPISGAGALGKAGSGTLVLDGANTYSGGTNLQAGTLQVGNDAALGTGTLTASGGTTLANQGPVTLNVPVSLQGDMTVSTAAPLTLSNTVSGSGGLVKQGGSDLTLAGANSYSGTTRLDAGGIIVGTDTSLGTGTLVAAGGTSLDASAPVRLQNDITLNNGNLIFSGSNPMELSGAIGETGGPGGIVKNGAATLTLDGPGSYTGNTSLNAGTLIVGSNSALGSGTLVAQDGTSLDSNAAVTLQNAVQLDGTLSVPGSAGLTLNGEVAGPGALVKNGPAALTLNGDNTYTGGTSLAGGTLVAGSNTALGAGPLTAAGGTTLQSGGAVALANDVTLNGPVGLNGANDLTLNGVISGAGALDKSGSGTLTLNGANTYGGGTALQEGTLVAGNAAALGTGALTVNGPSSLQASTPLVLGNALTLNNALTVAGTNDLTLSGNIGGTGSLVKTDSSTLTLGGTNSYTGGTTLTGGTLAGNTGSLQGNIATASGTTVNFNQGSDGTFTGSISGAGSLVKVGTGTVRLDGANSYTGGTSIDAGTLIGNASSLQGNVANNGTLVFDQGSNGSFAGVITGAGNVVKNGAADLTLTGDSTVGGGTTVNSGTLLVDGSLAGGPITVSPGAALGGSGRVTSDVTIGDGAHLVAGTPQNPISIGGSLNLSPNSQLDFSLGSPNSSTNAVTVANNLTLDGVLNVADAGSLGTGVYHLFQYGGTLTDNGLVYGTLPAGFPASSLTLQNQPAQVNLIVQGTPGELEFWNGTKTVADGQIGGGAGTWDAALTNWTDPTGSASLAWNGKFAAFAGTGGTVTVNGAQAVTGLQFLADGYTLAQGVNGTVDLSQAETPVRVDNGATATIAVPITGTGGLDKQDGGTLVLASPNTYAGGTTVSAGTLQVSADEQLGAPTGGVTLDGGRLAVAGAGYAGTARAVTLGAAGGTIDVQAAAQEFALAQGLAGTGALTKAGAGTLVLNGASTYTGGTTIAQGTVAGNSSSLQGGINAAAGTTLRFDQNIDGSFAGSLGGSGQLVKNGAGALTLTQPNSYTGGTQVNAGALIGDSTSLQGNINDNASVVFDQPADGAFAGTLSGNGTVVKQGAGTLTATGQQLFTGTVLVNAGTLQLGTATASAQLPANVQVNPGGTLSGAGNVSSLSNAGTVFAGASARGNLQVAGNFQNTANGVVQVDLSPPAPGTLEVAGTAALDGTLRVAPGFQFDGTQTYTVLTAGQGVQGQFASTELPNLAFVDASVAYAPNDVTVNFARNQTGFDDLAQTPNEEAVARALQRVPTTSSLYGDVLGLTRDQAAGAFRQLSGDSHASLPSALLATAQTARIMPMNRLRDSLYSDAGRDSGGACNDEARQNGNSFFSCRRNVWADVIGNWQSQDGDGNSSSYRQHTGGVMVGGDIDVKDGWRVGAALGYQDSNIWQDSRNARADVDNYSATIFGGKAFGMRNGAALNVMGGVSYGWSNLRTRRDVQVGSDNQELKANYSANTAQVFGELGYAIPVAPGASVEPFAGLAYANQRMHGFSEDGGSAELHAGSDSTDVTTSTIGLRGRLNTSIGGRAAGLRATLGWRHAMGDVDPQRTMAFDSGPAFTVTGAPIARDAAVLELGADISVSRSTTVGLSYGGQFGDGSRENAGFVNVRWSF